MLGRRRPGRRFLRVAAGARGRLRALRSSPDPAEFALWLSARHREGLRTAWRSNRTAGGSRPQYVRELRLLGLVEVSGDTRDPAANAHSRNYLGSFGNAVRKILLAAEVAD
jgi:hypothetical protein